jgi:hypothetical protein
MGSDLQHTFIEILLIVEIYLLAFEILDFYFSLLFVYSR